MTKHLIKSFVVAILMVTVVDMQDSTDGGKFVPQTVVIHAGDSVQWTNDPNNRSLHNATNGDWDTDLLHPGENATIKFPKIGTFPYYCEPHKKDMTGTVEVK